MIIFRGVTILNKLATLLLIAILISTVAVYFENQSWIFSLFVHFQHWFLLICLFLLALVPWISKKKYLYLILCVFASAFFANNIFSHWRPLYTETTKKKEPSIQVFYANVNSQNQTKEKLISHLEKSKPNFVLLVEINQAWAKKLKQLETIYPYSKMILQESNFGLGILSQHPLEVSKVFSDRENSIPALILKVQAPIGEISLALLHAFPPIGSYGTLVRDQYLKTLSFHFEDIQSPLLVCGDFNTTPWSSVFNDFLKNSKLETAFRTLNTWPTSYLFPSIPIDHCLTKNMNIANYRRGPKIESDHWPLLLEISLKNPDRLRSTTQISN